MARYMVVRVSLWLLLLLALGCAGAEVHDEGQAQFNRGLSLFNRGRFAEAVPAFERATELRPDWGEAYLYLGRSHLSLGQWRDALPPLRAAYRLAPDQTRREAGELILDVLLQHASEMDPLLRTQFEELVRNP